MATAGNHQDEFDAVRAVVDLLKNFAADDQRQIIRWAMEKLGLSPLAGGNVIAPPVPKPGEQAPVGGSTRDIRSFLQQKGPSSDAQFAAAVAYFHIFEVPDAAKKQEITASDLQEAARLSGHDRFHKPIVTLHNAVKRGYLDKGRDRGSFRINTVGENLVAMAMPGGGDKAASPGRTKSARARRRSKPAKAPNRRKGK